MLEEMKRGRRRSPQKNARHRPPFAIDFEDPNDPADGWDQLSIGSHSFNNSYSSWGSFSRSDSVCSAGTQGFRSGGPKEARLRRVALLSKAKEVDNLLPVKVENIPTRPTSPEKRLEDEIKEQFSEFGVVGDVYVPINYKNGQAKRDFAIVRYENREAVERATSPEATTRLSRHGQRALVATPLSKQQSFFSKGTGYLGISNEACGRRDPAPDWPEQSMSLESCRSRNGYPWSSVRELKYLNPHPSKDVLDCHSIRIEIPQHVTVDQLSNMFGMYGKLGAVTCPQPMIVSQNIGMPNQGFAFVRYYDRRDMQTAMLEIEAGGLVIDGFTVRGKVLPPQYWPTEKTRRYY